MFNYRITSVLIGLAVMLLAACGTSAQEHNRRVIQEAELPEGAAQAISDAVAFSQERNQMPIFIQEISELGDKELFREAGHSMQLAQLSAPNVFEGESENSMYYENRTAAIANASKVWCVRFTIRSRRADFETFIFTSDHTTYYEMPLNADGRDGDEMWDYFDC